MADDQAFLSARVPVEVRNRFKMLAASQGLNVQELLRTVVGEYLASQRVPEATDVIRTVREHAEELRSQGVKSLSLFGSVARNEAEADSDIDLTVEFQPDKRVSLIDLGHIQYLLEDYLGGRHKVDLSLRRSLKDHVVEGMLRDEVVILS